MEHPWGKEIKVVHMKFTGSCMLPHQVCIILHNGIWWNAKMCYSPELMNRMAQHLAWSFLWIKKFNFVQN